MGCFIFGLPPFYPLYYMDKKYVEGQCFEKTDFSLSPLPLGEYENCTFRDCILAESDLSDMNFAACEFIACNLSMARLSRTVLRDVSFKACKLLGLPFKDCNPLLFTAEFDKCTLNLASFHKMKLKKARFAGSSLHETDFSESDLTGAVFQNCDLERAIFLNTIMEKADFRTSYHYTIDPELNRIKKAMFSISGVAGLLEKYDIQLVG